MSALYFKDLQAATNSLFEQKLGNHPLLQHVFTASISHADYARYLRETYHLVNHTPRFLALTAANIRPDRRRLRDYFLSQASEEDGHDLLCVNDLRKMNMDVDEILSSGPMEGAWFMVTQSYYNASHAPLRNLGLASLTEELGSSVAGSIADVLIANSGIPRVATSFLRGHSSFDVKHLKEIEQVINDNLESQAELDEVIKGREMAIAGYSRLFSDLYENLGADDPSIESSIVEFKRA